MPIPSAEQQKFLQCVSDRAFCFRSVEASAFVEGDTGYLVFTSQAAAGAIGKAQGEALRDALTSLKQKKLRQLVLWINSSGAHFEEPMQGLAYLNVFLEALWKFRAKGVRIRVVCDGWLYGGMAMMLAAAAHEIVLSESASMGLFGGKVLQGQVELVPKVDFQTKHLQLKRITNLSLL